jgi:two-component system alkaline phosphatase synthesis response regulator PhoP
MGAEYMAKRILVVEDERSIQELILYNIKKEGYEVLAASDGRAALEMLARESIDLVVLDLMLPELDGVEVCKHIRQKFGYSIYVLMLTAKGEEIDRILGIEVGADDYMVKPFSPRELLVRIKAAFRRSSTPIKQGTSKLVIGDLKVDRDQYSCEFQGVSLEFTPKQFALLVYLMENKGKVCTREELLTAVWGFDYYGDTRTVDVHISQLRHRLAEVAGDKNIPIQTLRGVGYRFRSDG